MQALIFSFKVLLLVVVLATVWEFAIEDSIFALLTEGEISETFDEHVKYILTVSAFVFVALIAPTITLHRYIQRRDIAEQKAHHLATHDPLTNLPNRNLLFDRLSQTTARAHRDGGKLAVLFIDLDGFKDINDSLGHNAGDFVLTSTASRLVRSIRETDTVARFGGDEFLIIVTEVNDSNHVLDIISKIEQEISAPSQFGEHIISIGASIGHAIYPDHGEEADDLINIADNKMYEEKNASRK